MLSDLIFHDRHLFRDDRLNSFDPDQPRDDDGRWKATGGIAARNKMDRAERRDKTWVDSSGKSLDERIQKLGIPPAWTSVHVAHDPHADLQAIGVDAKGRIQRIYSPEFVRAQSEKKFARIEKLRAQQKSIFERNDANLSSGKTDVRENAAAMHLIQHLGIRPGSDADTKAKMKAYGATTLEGRHVVIEGDSLRLRFIGKKGVQIDLPVEDPITMKLLRDRKERAGETGRLFDTTSEKLREYSHSLGSGEFKPKDFRTLKGTEEARKLVEENPSPPTSIKDYKQRVKRIAQEVAMKLGNTATVALQSYINPRVFSDWKTAVA